MCRKLCLFIVIFNIFKVESFHIVGIDIELYDAKGRMIASKVETYKKDKIARHEITTKTAKSDKAPTDQTVNENEGILLFEDPDAGHIVKRSADKNPQAVTKIYEESFSEVVTSFSEETFFVAESQYVPNQEIPKPLALSYTPQNVSETSSYNDLKQEGETKFIGYGRSSFADFIPEGIPGVGASPGPLSEKNVQKDCMVSNAPKFILCATDGNTYNNLSEFYCAQMLNKDLKKVWDGPCNRTEWVTGIVDAENNLMKLKNPDEITRYFSN